MIPVYKPYLNDKVTENVKNAIESTWISSAGAWRDTAVSQLKKLLEVDNVLLVNNGTAATHLIAKSLKFRRPSIKNIIVPNNVYVAAWNCFLYDKELKLMPIDADEDTWNIDIDKLKEKASQTNPADTAILVVPNLGNTVNVPSLKREFPEHLFVEDNCEGLFGKYEGCFSGTKSLASSVSFYGNKTITSGEGGAVMTADKELYEYLDRIHGQGQTNTRFIHDLLAHNYRMTNVQAAILSAQLEQSDWIRDRKLKIFERYRNNLKGVAKIKTQKTEEDCLHSTWMFGIRASGSSYQSLRAYMNMRGVDVRPMFYPMSRHAHLTKHACVAEEVVAKLLAQECAILPSYPGLQNEQIDFICESLEEYIRSL